ncbi:MAG: hypothetical protein P1P64_08230 [Treponemataceae bacterium]
MKIRNYLCSGDDKLNTGNLNQLFEPREVFSDSVKYKKALEALSKNNSFVFLPLTDTLEAELQGATINENSFVRVKEPFVKSVDELFSLKSFSYEVPHYKIISECFDFEYDKPLMYEMSGLFTFLSFIIPIEQIFRSFRKNPELQNKIIKTFLEKYFAYIERLKKFPVKLISIADPVASLEIIGPKCLEKLVKSFYLKLIDYILNETNFSIYLCPKLFFAIEDLNLMRAESIPVKKQKMQNAILNMLDKKIIFGDLCINANPEIKNLKVFSTNFLKASQEDFL